MLLGMFIMFVVMAGGAGIVTWLVWLRLAEHLKENHEAVSALTTHLFVPLLGRKEAPRAEPGQEPKRGDDGNFV